MKWLPPSHASYAYIEPLVEAWAFHLACKRVGGIIFPPPCIPDPTCLLVFVDETTHRMRGTPGPDAMFSHLRPLTGRM